MISRLEKAIYAPFTKRLKNRTIRQMGHDALRGETLPCGVSATTC